MLQERKLQQKCHICEAVCVGRNQGEGRYVENGVGKWGRVWWRICEGRNGTQDVCLRCGSVLSHMLPEFR